MIPRIKLAKLCLIGTLFLFEGFPQVFPVGMSHWVEHGGHIVGYKIKFLAYFAHQGIFELEDIGAFCSSGIFLGLRVLAYFELYQVFVCSLCANGFVYILVRKITALQGHNVRCKWS